MLVQGRSTLKSLVASLANEAVVTIVYQLMSEHYPLASELLVANVAGPRFSGADFLMLLEVFSAGVSHQTLLTLVFVGVFVSFIQSKDPHASL